MKNGLIILTVVLLTAQNLFAQTQIDSANIVKTIVEQQILMAKQKQNNSLIAENSFVTNPIKSVSKIHVVDKSEKQINISPAVMKFAVILFASVVVFGFVFVRREKIKKTFKKNELKSNIKKIRNEQLVISIDPRLKAIRKKLVMNSPYLNAKEKNQFARENRISSSEFALAEKLKEYGEAVLQRGEL